MVVTTLYANMCKYEDLKVGVGGSFFKAWLHGWWITIDHQQARTSCLTIRLRVAYETLTRPTVDAH